MPPKPPTKEGDASGADNEPVKVESASQQQPAPDAPMSGTNTPIGTPSGTPAPGTPASRPGSVRPSPAVRGRGGAKPQPRGIGRRSAASRAELEAAAAKKKEADAKAAVEEAKRKAKEDRKFGYGRGRGGKPRGGRGRGGHMSDRPREHTSEAVGVFGGGRTVADAKSSRTSRPGYSGSGGGGGGGGGGTSSGGGRSGGSGYYAGSSIKREAGDRDVSMGGMQPPMTTEDGGYISSDEDEAEGVKRDIDRMQVIDLTGDEPEVDDPFVPVRLTRVEHKERAVGVQAVDSPDTSDGAEVISDRKKGKQRAKDVEVTGTAAVPKRPTTYSSSDTEGEPQIKQEPTDDENTRPTTPEPGAAATSDVHDMPSSPESKRKAKEKIKANADAANADGNESDIERPSEPHFQTQAEKDEWVRHYDDKQNIRHELGRLVPKDAAQPDAEGDTAMADDTPHLKRARERQRLREEHVYLFQFPPVLPDLRAISIKDEKEAAARSNGDGGDAMDVDDDTNDTITADDTAASRSNRPNLPSGQVGKLRVHKSGKTTLDWGGTSMVLGLGAEATFLQNVLIAKVPETKPKEGEKPPDQQEDAVAMGMGIVRAKFVVTPDWGEILK